MATTSPGSRSGSRERVAGRGGAHFSRDLTAPGLTLLTIGGVMGSGLFLASGLAIRAAGPAVLGVFALALLAMYLEMSALGEMAAADPVPGSFLVYCRRVLGPGFTFVTGWIYWFSSVLTMSSEVTAAALFTRMWFPQLPLWAWSLAYSALIIALNFFGVRGFATVEGVMAGVKTVAVLAFVAVGLLFLAGALPTRLGAAVAPGWNPGSGAGGWLPHGLLGTSGALLLVLFAYAGTGVIGMAAAETRRPATTIPRAVAGTVALVAVMYLGSAYLLTAMQPWATVPVDSSPFVSALRGVALPGAATLMNLVLLFAVLSTMNAALYANVRVLYTLAAEGQAPPWLGRLNRRGIPARATWASASLLLGAIALAFALPHKAYAYLVTATGFQAMFIWLMVLLTHLHYRPHLRRQDPQGTGFRLWGYPYTTLLVIAIVLAGLAGSLGAGSERVGAGIGFGGIAVAALVWVSARRALRSRGGGPASGGS